MVIVVVIVVVVMLAVSHAETFSLFAAVNPPFAICSKQTGHIAGRDVTPGDVGFLVIRPEISRLKRGWFALGFARKNNRLALRLLMRWTRISGHLACRASGSPCF
jgi:hypothetical protein